MIKTIITSTLLLTSVVFGESLMLDRGTLRTLNDLNVTLQFENNKIKDQELLKKFNYDFERNFKFKTKPFSYYKFLEELNVGKSKLTLISEVSRESGKYLLGTKGVKINTNLTISAKDELYDKLEKRAKKIFMIRYLFILKDYSMSDINDILDYYKSNEYQENLSILLNSIHEEESKI